MPSTTSHVLQAEGLRKVYGHKVAVADLWLELRPGEAFGLLGPNGAGKSTSLKMLLGLVRPTAGVGFLLGRPLGDVEARSKVGFLSEHFRFQDWLSGVELLHLHGQLYGMAPRLLARRIAELLARVGLDRQGSKPLRAYSKGMTQRIGLAQALLNHPDLILLDEPTSGLDPLGRLLVRDIIREECARGAAVLLNSHLLGEVEASCGRVAFVKGGVIVETRELGGESATPARVRLRARHVPEEVWRRCGAQAVTASGNDVWTVELAGSSSVPELLRMLVEGGAAVYECSPLQPSLEDDFLRIIGSEAGREGSLA